MKHECNLMFKSFPMNGIESIGNIEKSKYWETLTSDGNNKFQTFNTADRNNCTCNVHINGTE